MVRMEGVDVLMEYGLIKRVERDIDQASVAKETLVYDARGRMLTSGRDLDLRPLEGGVHDPD